MSTDFFSAPAAHGMDGNFFRKPNNEATFPAASVSILLEDTTVQQSRFEFRDKSIGLLYAQSLHGSCTCIDYCGLSL